MNASLLAHDFPAASDADVAAANAFLDRINLTCLQCPNIVLSCDDHSGAVGRLTEGARAVLPHLINRRLEVAGLKRSGCTPT
jgi:hypothetical protein